ncbi:DUF4190 domain-containing protein [Actinosynnema pretiosum subsp. pretiosum]|uniref:DUF4190 domain-containing protein n=2 Tax=Actinosynnema TaxID=40566 RepID=C6WN77_ACTMD|nr:DUF4190 domain-containing protein [Actinosynnema mirum]ACU40441.1 hypothetical protein Amir_6644 [Actinosynnema mirum DSM 43827]AXX33955.1 hypothetical protein APASM_6590 [Actinosynnema pretiosum subsp. pretiosum]QUF02300.1 DUF4190 domain-containing protein [Actinosynnema pretiosum subsp. pretiosum]
MSYPQQYAQHAPQGHQQPAQNGLATGSLVLGVVGLLLSFIPFIGVIAWPLVIVGLVLGLVAVSKLTRNPANSKGLAISGTVLSALGLVVCVLWLVGFGAAVGNANEQAEKEVTVVYEVTGDAPSASVNYSSYGDGTSEDVNEDITTLPWKKEVRTRGLFSGSSLMVSTGAGGGAVTCKVFVDGQEKKTATASGEFAIASCSNF